MMQTEPNFNFEPKTSANSEPPVSANLEPQAQLTRTRCPGCQKLFAVETETLNAMARAGVVQAEFTCTAPLCRTSFAIELPLSTNVSAMTIVPAVRLEDLTTAVPTAAEQGLVEAVAELPGMDTPVGEPPKPVIEAPLKTRASVTGGSTGVLAKRAAVAERECPRCGAMNAASLNECPRCGIVFDRYAATSDAQMEEELALGGTRELAQLWEKVIEDYEDRIRHDRFVNACRDASALSYASKKYSQILIAAPQDDIARLMRNRIVAMISMRAESSKLPIRLSFRIPKLNSIALFGGSLLFFWGLMMPQLKNVMEIGLSLVLLSIGVRLALRSRI